MLNTSQDQSMSKRKRKRTLDDYEFIKETKIVKGEKKSSELLGKGAFGSVRLARELATGQIVAIKAINKSVIAENQTTEQLKREIKIQKKLDHPYIIKLYHEFEDNQFVYLVLEYAKEGNLFFYLRKQARLKEQEAFVFFLQTSLGLDYLHKNNIIHRDLKPENLLIDSQGNVKICDFGWSAEANGIRKTFCGTMEYISPEMLKNTAHDHRIDIWAMGILLFEMLHGHAPFQMMKNNRSQITQAILACEVSGIPFGSAIPEDARDLIKNILRIEPSNRLTFDQIFKHPWVQRWATETKIQIQGMIYKSPAARSNKFDEPKLDEPVVTRSVPEPLSNPEIPKVQSKSPIKMTEDMVKQKQLLFAPPQKPEVSPARSRERIFDIKPSGHPSVNMTYSNTIQNQSVVSVNRSRSREKIFDVSKVDPQTKSMSSSQLLIQKYQNKQPDMIKSAILPTSGNSNNKEEDNRQKEVERQAELDIIQKQKVEQETQIRQQENEKLQKELERQQEIERQRQREQEMIKQRQEQERLKYQESKRKEELQRLEAQRRKEQEQQEELQKIMEQQKRQAQIEYEQRQKELEKSRLIEQQKREQEQRQRDLEIERQQQVIIQKEQEQRQREIEIQRQKELQIKKEQELKQQELEIQRQQALQTQREIEQRQKEQHENQQRYQSLKITVTTIQQQADEQRQRDFQLQQQRDQQAQQRIKDQQLRDQELQRQKSLEAQEYQRQQQLKNEQEQRQREQEKQEQEYRNIELRRQEQLQKQKEQQQLRQVEDQKKKELEEQYYRQRQQVQIPEEDRINFSINQSNQSIQQKLNTSIQIRKEKEVFSSMQIQLEQKLDLILGQNFGIDPVETQPMRGDASFEASMQQKYPKDQPEWDVSDVQKSSIGNQSLLTEMIQSKSSKQQAFPPIEEVLETSLTDTTKHAPPSPMNQRQTRFTSNSRPTNIQDRNTYIGELIDNCLDELDMQDNPQIQLLRQLDDPNKPRRVQQQSKQRFQSTPHQQVYQHPQQQVPAFGNPQDRKNKFSFGEAKVEPDFGRQTKISPEPISVYQYNNLRVKPNQGPQQTKVLKVSNNQSINNSKFPKYEDLEDDDAQNLENLKRSRSLPKEEPNEYDVYINNFNKYDGGQQMQNSQQQSNNRPAQKNNHPLPQKSQQVLKNPYPGQHHHSLTQSQQHDPLGLSFNDNRFDLYYQNRTKQDQDYDDDESHQRIGPRKSRISERNEISRRKKEIQRNDHLQQMDFFDRVKYAFGCLTRPQQGQK